MDRDIETSYENSQRCPACAAWELYRSDNKGGMGRVKGPGFNNIRLLLHTDERHQVHIQQGDWRP